MIQHIGIIGPIHLPSINLNFQGDRSAWPVGMGGTPVNSEINALIELGYKISVYSLSPEVLDGDCFEYKDDNVSIFIGHYRPSASSRCFDFFQKEINVLKRIIIDDNPNVLHAHWQYEWALAGIESNLPCLITCHDDPLAVLLNYKDIYRLCRLFLALKVYKKGKYFTAVSPMLPKSMNMFFGDKIKTIIPNFINDNFFEYNKVRLCKDLVKIVMINNGFTKAKNVERGLRVIQEFDSPNLELHLYGKDFEEGGPADNFCKSIGLNSNVYFHGYVSPHNILNELDKYNILLHTSRIESFGMVLIEAMSMGIPVIAGSEVEGPHWILNQGGGILVDIDNSCEIMNAIKEVLNNYNRLSKEASDIVKRRFSKEIVVNQYLQELSLLR